MLTRHPDHLNGVPTHVLVVDDDKTIRRYVATVLERAQYRVSTVPDAEAALQLIETDMPDLVILDQELPDMSGDALLRQWRAQGEPRDFPVIFFSNDPSAERFRAVMNMGADDYLVKPVKPRELSDAVAVQLNKFRTRQAGRLARTGPRPAAAPVHYPGVPPGYQVYGTLAKGGSAIAYRARRAEDGAECVIKVIELFDELDDALLARFTREGRVLERIVHPGVVRVYAHGVGGAGDSGDGGASAGAPTADAAGVIDVTVAAATRAYAYVAMEYVAGGTLRTMLGRPWEAPAALGLLLKIAESLAAVHAAGVVHRDIKPDNVMLRANSLTPVLVDFGTAKDLQEGHQHTRKGVILGTPSYMAPELITGGEPTPATDMYACGAMLYELLTGSKPYSGENIRELLRRHLDFPVPHLHSAVAGLQPLLARLLAKRAEDRPQDGAALAVLLREQMLAVTGSSAILSVSTRTSTLTNTSREALP